MRNLKAILAVLLTFAIAFVSPSFAAVGIKVNGVSVGTATDLNFSQATTTTGSTWDVPLILAGTSNAGAVSMATNELAVSTSYALVRKAIAGDAAFSAGTLANATPGKILTIFITSVSGSGTFVLTPTTKTGFTTLTFDAAKDQATLLFVDSTTGWILLSQTSVTVAIP